MTSFIRLTFYQRFKSLFYIQIRTYWKSGRFEKWGSFWHSLFLDYKSVALDVCEDAKKKPVKALMTATGLVSLLSAIKNNPGLDSFHNEVIKCQENLLLISKCITNSTSERHVYFLTSCENRALLRAVNCIFFTIVWIEDYNRECQVYAAQCTYLKPKYTSMAKRIVDVGLFGKWLNMEWKMRDYDVSSNALISI